MAKSNSNSYSDHLQTPTDNSSTKPSARASVDQQSRNDIRIDTAFKKTKAPAGPTTTATSGGLPEERSELERSVQKQIEKLRQSIELSEQCEHAKNDRRVSLGSPRQVSHQRGPSFLDWKKEPELR